MGLLEAVPSPKTVTKASLLNKTESASVISRVDRGQRARASVHHCSSGQKAYLTRRDGHCEIVQFKETTSSFSIQLLNYPQQLAHWCSGVEVSLAEADNPEAEVQTLGDNRTDAALAAV